jgi:hypothetical protein
MLKIYTVGDRIPEKIEQVVEEWNYWEFIIVPNTNSIGNRIAAETLAKRLDFEGKRTRVYDSEYGKIYVLYTFNVN